MYKELGGEIITVGSDAHKKTDLARDFDIAYEILKECGFNYYTRFEKLSPLFAGYLLFKIQKCLNG